VDWRAKECGKSEGHPVMGWIGIEERLSVFLTASYAKAGRLPRGLSSRENLPNRQRRETQMKAVSACAPSHKTVDWNAIDWRKAHQNVRRLQVRIVKAMRDYLSQNRVPQGAFERLEPDEGKLSCPVPRGLGGSNAPRLPGKADSACAPSRKIVDWNAIDWRKAHQNVRRLQVRIVKAMQEGRWGKVKALQRLLTHSFSGRVMAVRRVTENRGKMMHPTCHQQIHNRRLSVAEPCPARGI
jgi:hypothetical protein